MKTFYKLNDIIGKIEVIFINIFLMTMIILAFTQVVARNIFNSGIPWADTVVRLMVLWVGFLGGCLATKLEQNLTIEVLTKYMSDNTKHFVSILMKIFGSVVCYYLFMASLRF